MYLGDGKGDYCPSIKLSEKDYVMPRKSYPLWELIYTNTQSIKAKVHEWSDGEELEKVLLQLINESLSADRCDNIVPLRLAADFKCHTVPLPSSPVALPKALPVPH